MAMHKLDPPRDHLTAEEVDAALTDGSRWRFGVDLLSATDREPVGIPGFRVERAGVRWAYRAVDPTRSVDVADATPRRTGELVMEHVPDFNPLSVYYRPWVEVQSPQAAPAAAPTFTRASTAYLDAVEHATGEPRYTTGGGVLIEEGTDNRLTEAQSLSVDPTAYSGSNLDGVRTDDPDAVGGAFLRCTKPATGDSNLYATNVPVTEGEVLIATIWARNVDSDYFRFGFNWNGGSGYELLTFDLTQEWARYEVVATVPAGETSVNVGMYQGNQTAGTTFDVDAWQAELRSYPTTWQTGGTTRDAERAWIPSGPLLASEGSIELDIDLQHYDMKASARVFEVQGLNSSTNGLIFYNRGNVDWRAYAKNDAGEASFQAISFSVMPEGHVYRIAVAWGANGDSRWFINGDLVTTIPLSYFPSVLNEIYFGSRGSGDYALNNPVLSVRLSNRARTDAELADWQRPLYADADTTYLLPLDGDLAARKGEWRWVPFRLGLFTVAKLPRLSHDGAVSTRQLTLTEVSGRWAERRLMRPLTIEPGTNVVKWVKDDLQVRFKEPDVSGIDDSTVTLGQNAAWDHDYIVFDRDTPLIDVYDRLLAYAGYEPLYVDVNGRPIGHLARDPQEQAAVWTFGLPLGTGVAPEVDVEPITPELPNVLVFEARNGPSLMEEGNGRRTIRNEDVGPGSINQRNRFVEDTVTVEADSQDELDRIARMRAQRLFAGGGWTLSTVARAVPLLGDSDVVSLAHTVGTSGVWVTTQYGFSMVAGDESAIVEMDYEAELLVGAAFAGGFVTPPAVGTKGVGYGMVAA